MGLDVDSFSQPSVGRHATSPLAVLNQRLFLNSSIIFFLASGCLQTDSSWFSGRRTAVAFALFKTLRFGLYPGGAHLF